MKTLFLLGPAHGKVEDIDPRVSFWRVIHQQTIPVAYGPVLPSDPALPETVYERRRVGLFGIDLHVMVPVNTGAGPMNDAAAVWFLSDQAKRLADDQHHPIRKD